MFNRSAEVGGSSNVPVERPRADTSRAVDRRPSVQLFVVRLALYPLRSAPTQVRRTAHADNCDAFERCSATISRCLSPADVCATSQHTPNQTFGNDPQERAPPNIGSSLSLCGASNLLLEPSRMNRGQPGRDRRPSIEPLVLKLRATCDGSANHGGR
jgi:hypothetical protein